MLPAASCVEGWLRQAGSLKQSQEGKTMGFIRDFIYSDRKSKCPEVESCEHTQIFSIGALNKEQGFITQPRAELEVTAGNALGMKFPLVKDVCTIGRKEGNDICLQDPNVSRLHARIEQAAENFTVIDLGSTNGTYVNGRRVVKATVKAGDSITLGKTELKFQVVI